MADRIFRFGLVTPPASTGTEWAALARRAEDLGFSTLLVPDGIGMPSPVPALAAAAVSTERLRVGNFVLAAPLRTAESVAWDTATIDHLSQGRVELGFGAGRPDVERDAKFLGVPWGTPGERVAKVGEIIDTVRGVFAEANAGKAELGAFRTVQRPGPPIMVGGSGDRLLSIGARQADIVAIQASTEDELRRKLRGVADAAGDRFDDLELSTNLFTVGDGELPQWVARFIDTSTATENRNLTVLNGDIGTAVDVLKRRRDEFGVSYITVNGFALKTAAPVVERLAGS